VCAFGLARRAGWRPAYPTGDADIVAAGGQGKHVDEPPRAQNLRPSKNGRHALIDTMIRGRLWDAFHGYHRPNRRKNVAAKNGKSAATPNDEFASRLAKQAELRKKPVKFKDGDRAFHRQKLERRDYRRSRTNYIPMVPPMEKPCKAPRFRQRRICHSGQTRQGLNDGRQALANRRKIMPEKRGISTPLSRIASYAHRRPRTQRSWAAASDYASRKALEKSRLKAEGSRPRRSHEAFSVSLCS